MSLPEKIILGHIIAQFIQLRRDQNLSHEKLAAKAKVSRMAISYIESGKRLPSMLICLQIAQALNVRLSAVIKTAEEEKTIANTDKSAAAKSKKATPRKS